MMFSHNIRLKYLILVSFMCLAISCRTKSLTKLGVTEQQSHSVNPAVNNEPYGVSMSKLLGEWKSIDRLNYRIQFDYFNSGFVLHNLDTPFFYFKDIAYSIPLKSAPLVPFYFSSDSIDVVNSVGYFQSEPELYFLLNFISNDTLLIRYSQLQVEKMSILYSRKQTTK